VFFLVAVGRGRILEPIAPERAEDVMEWLHGVAESEPFGVKTTEAPFYRRVGLQSDGDEEATRRRGGITAGRGFAFVSHTGEAYPSGFLPSPPVTSTIGRSSISTGTGTCSSRSASRTG